MNPPRVLIGSPICQDPSTLNEYLLSLKNIDISGLDVSFYFIDDNTDETSKHLLSSFRVDRCNIETADMKNSDEYIHTDVTHKWNDKMVCKVTEYRNMLLSKALKDDCDYLFMVDSDLMLHPCTLKHLIDQQKDIISEIFWTMWAPGGMEYPQVWLYDNNTLYEKEAGKFLSESEIRSRTMDFINKLRAPGVYKVGGLGACTLISSKALKSGISYDRLYNISFWGEDRHFCIRAAALGFELYVDTNYPAYHIYRKAELKGTTEFKRKCGYKIPVRQM